MKKVLLSICTLSVFLTLTAMTCSKEDKTEDKPKAGSWTFAGTVYTATSTVTSPSIYNFTAYDATGNTLAFLFSSDGLPKSSGKYKVIRTGSGIKSGEVIVDIIRQSGTGNYFTSTGNDGVYADVTVKDGKISVSLPNTWMLEKENRADSFIVSGNINQVD